MQKVRVDGNICRSCKYAMYFGPSTHNRKVACNYQGIENQSRIFENGKMVHEPEFCTKYVKGRMLQKEWTNFSIGHQEMDVYEDYKIQKIKKEVGYNRDI